MLGQLPGAAGGTWRPLARSPLSPSPRGHFPSVSLCPRLLLRLEVTPIQRVRARSNLVTSAKIPRPKRGPFTGARSLNFDTPLRVRDAALDTVCRIMARLLVSALGPHRRGLLCARFLSELVLRGREDSLVTWGPVIHGKMAIQCFCSLCFYRNSYEECRGCGRLTLSHSAEGYGTWVFAINAQHDDDRNSFQQDV